MEDAICNSVLGDGFRWIGWLLDAAGEGPGWRRSWLEMALAGGGPGWRWPWLEMVRRKCGRQKLAQYLCSEVEKAVGGK